MLLHVSRSFRSLFQYFPQKKLFSAYRLSKAKQKTFAPTRVASLASRGTILLPSQFKHELFAQRWYTNEVQEASPESQLKRVDPGKDLSALDRFLRKNQVSNIPEYVISKIDAVINWARKGIFFFIIISRFLFFDSKQCKFIQRCG
jgi:hypothetical protein